MSWYSDILMLPRVKIMVVFLFLLMFGGLAYCTSLLDQSFDHRDVLPRDSYVTGWVNGADKFNDGNTITGTIYFRNVDQSDVSIQSQMEEYVNKLVDLEYVVAPPLRFWIRDFKMAVEEAEKNNLISESLSFNEQLDYFLREYPQYDNDIAYDKEGNIWTSCTKVTLRLDLNNNMS